MLTSVRRTSIAALLLVAIGLATHPVHASDPVGIYALIDRVVLEPDGASPTAIQIWGVFSLSDGKGGDHYGAPVRGYLYYAINRSNERAVRAEWGDLRAIAGTNQPIGFGQKYAPLGRVRRASEPPAQPDTYPIGVGLVRVLGSHLGPAVNRDLQRVPAAVAPADGARVEPGSVKLVAHNVPDPKVQYVFEIENASSVKETSPPLTAGRTETTWAPKMPIRRGERYTWRVWTVDGTWQGPAASATFSGGQ